MYIFYQLLYGIIEGSLILEIQLHCVLLKYRKDPIADRGILMPAILFEVKTIMEYLCYEMISFKCPTIVEAIAVQLNMYDPRDEAKKSKCELPFVIGTQRSVIMKTFLKHENISQLKSDIFGQTLINLCCHAQEALNLGLFSLEKLC